ncbi:MAG: tRNA (cytidine(56)-2'-O)-methyltransferase [Candidatus Micrarchaeota archaeon]|nr:tRNA (cytidine(56)-2'-O)-methyltransferase [Candidatus Micrarchaeota archaeon]
MGKICVLRLGHRVGRDQRITTHVFLVARALGASEGVLCGDEDQSVLDGTARVRDIWGGDFTVKYEREWKKFLRERKANGWKVVHLTMYGTDFQEGAKKMASSKKNVVVIIGAGKVPTEAYHMADMNLSVANQPHSEVAALALFLDRFFAGKELKKKFSGKLKITPNKCGKIVQRVEND